MFKWARKKKAMKNTSRQLLKESLPPQKASDLDLQILRNHKYLIQNEKNWGVDWLLLK